MVPFEEIERNAFNLNLPRYIDSQTPEDLQDIEGHLKGGIPVADIDALQRYWTVCPGLRQTLFRDNRPGYVDLAVEKAAIKSTIYEHPEFAAFTARMSSHFAAWRDKSADTLRHLEAGCQPKRVIDALAESLLAHYAGQPLIDAYDVYQHLMDYGAKTMEDDCYAIAADGWKAETTRIIQTDSKGKEKDKGWTCDLVPKELVVARYFPEEQAAIDQLAVELETIAARLAELEEEHSGEDGALSELEKVNRASVAARMKEVSGLFAVDEETKAEADVLDEWLALSKEEADLNRRLKQAEAVLDAKAYAQYPKLAETDIQALVVDDKWLAKLDQAVRGEIDRTSQALTQRVRDLAARYDTPLPKIINRVMELEAMVNGHLEKMGVSRT
jgi:type I restriction enzyme M protein